MTTFNFVIDNVQIELKINNIIITNILTNKQYVSIYPVSFGFILLPVSMSTRRYLLDCFVNNTINFSFCNNMLLNEVCIIKHRLTSQILMQLPYNPRNIQLNQPRLNISNNDRLNSSDNDRLRADNDRLRTDNDRLRTDNDRLRTDNDKLRNVSNSRDDAELAILLSYDLEKLRQENNILKSENMILREQINFM
jgi:hypothetical protein